MEITRYEEAPLSLYRLSTDAATATSEIVKATAKEIHGRRFVSVEGWQAIAIAHGCVTSATDVERVDGGVRAVGIVRRASDGMVLAQAEGFVGEDEPVWFGGVDHRGRNLPPRPMYAIRAMAQTRAISRACRSAFAHVVVMIDSSLGTTPAEEVITTEHPPVEDPNGAETVAGATSKVEKKKDQARTEANRRLYAVMRDAELITGDKAEDSRRAVVLAKAFLDKEIQSVSNLEVNEIHDLATCIDETRWHAFEVLGLDPLANE